MVTETAKRVADCGCAVEVRLEADFTYVKVAGVKIVNPCRVHGKYTAEVDPRLSAWLDDIDVYPPFSDIEAYSGHIKGYRIRIGNISERAVFFSDDDAVEWVRTTFPGLAVYLRGRLVPAPAPRYEIRTGTVDNQTHLMPAPLPSEAETLRAASPPEPMVIKLIELQHKLDDRISALEARLATLEAVGGWGRGTEPESIPTPGEEGEARAAIAAIKGNVLKALSNGRKFVVKQDSHYNPEEYEFVCDNPHGDGDFSYICGMNWCRCMQ